MPSTTEHLGAAIAALTGVGRGTRTIGAGTPHEHTEPVDFAELACHVLTAVAANVGSVEDLLAGRPGSWEADYVRRIVHGTAGGRPDDLDPWRTEPSYAPPGVTGRAREEYGLYPGATSRTPDAGPTW